MAALTLRWPEDKHQRLRALAQRRHRKHRMPEKNEPDTVDEQQTAFVERARQALLKAEAGGPVYDGPAYAAYLRERVRAALEPGQPAALAKPPPQSWQAIRAQRSSQ